MIETKINSDRSRWFSHRLPPNTTVQRTLSQVQGKKQVVDVPIPVELNVLPRKKIDGNIHLEATARGPGHDDLTLWFEVPERFEAALTTQDDPFVLGFLFPLMQWARPVRVKGVVSPSLLANLELLTRVWHMRFPDLYHPLDIRADTEEELAAENRNGEAISCFTGGIDSCFTVWRHAAGVVGRRQRNITAGLTVHGFPDTPLSKPEAFEAALENARVLLKDVGMEAIGIACNAHDLPVKGRHPWQRGHGVATGACLSLFARRFEYGLIPNSIPYKAIDYIYGTSPITDWMMSSSGFRIMDDGGEVLRARKVIELGSWPAALDRLRVCNAGALEQTNCGGCEKCIRTMISLRIIGIDNPKSFPGGVSNRQIRRMSIRYAGTLRIMERMREIAYAKGFGKTPWIKALEHAMRRGRRRLLRKWLGAWGRYFMLNTGRSLCRKPAMDRPPRLDIPPMARHRPTPDADCEKR